MADLENLIVEKNVIESRVHGYLSQGKTARYIRLNLVQKKFDSKIVNEVLAEKEDTIKNPETYRLQIERIIKKGIQK